MKWLGLAADYSPVERQIMQALPVPEQKFLHVLKATTDGEIFGGVAQQQRQPDKGESAVAVVPVSNPVSPQYTDPEDIEFGEAAPRNLVYALVWTPGNHRVVAHKTSKFPYKSANYKLKIWKSWYERQGWKVSSHSTGYFAAKGTERHAISLHEYDAETKERLK